MSNKKQKDINNNNNIDDLLDNAINFSPVYVSVLMINGLPIRYWLDEFKNDIGVLRISDNECITTYACDTPDDIITMLNWLDLVHNAKEVEL